MIFERTPSPAKARILNFSVILSDPLVNPIEAYVNVKPLMASGCNYGFAIVGSVDAYSCSARAITTLWISVVPSTTFITGAMRYILSSVYGARSP